MRRAAKVDANQGAIVEALRAAGASVEPLHAVGSGCPDLLVGFNGYNWLVEVKDGDKPPRERRLTDHQIRWHGKWKGQVCIVENVQQALTLIGRMS